MHQTLWRNDAGIDLISAPVPGHHLQAFALQQRARHLSKMARLQGTFGHRQQAHALADLIGGVAAGLQQCLQSVLQRGQVQRQHAGFNVGQQFVRRQQRIQLAGRKPQPRQFVHRP
ncbi:MAG: hypothetical protein A2503_06870 [Burkholderiales bacterium RIFOXYD12_FULL_59_19]|nr:MAG: hypothetical protein A2503_06870 [Burkholderiales bacterium RIFOXYD12_FULL_59_19]